MKRILQILSLVTLVMVVAAMVAQVLTVTQGITYDPKRATRQSVGAHSGRHYFRCGGHPRCRLPP